MPTTSSFFSKGAFTPVTMFWTSDRASPWRARTLRSSPAREMTTWVPSTFALSPGGRGWTSFPFGPSALTPPSTTWTFTPCGITMGFLPMRDIVRPSPHVGEDFPAHTLLPRVAIGRSEEHTSELQSLAYLVCRLLLEKKNNTIRRPIAPRTTED